MDKKRVAMTFASINKEIETLIPELKEVRGSGSEMVYYGADNRYPEYLYGLYTDCTSLKTVIDGTSDYVAGDDVRSNITGKERKINRRDTWKEFIFLLSRDLLLYGGYAYEVIRTKDMKDIAELHYLDFRDIRTDENNETFYYNPDFKKNYVKTSKTIILPRFEPDLELPNSVFYYKNNKSSVYPVPRYSGALKCCEMERSIDEMHLAGIQNGFYPSFMININSGIPTEEEQDEIETDIREKFGGATNVGRFILNFANGKDNAATIDKLDTVDFGEKYQAAAKRSREQIYASFRAIPALFGVMTETTGFNEQEFSEAFRLYNKTMVKPIQRNICDSFDYVFGQSGVVEITQMDLENNNITVN